MIQRLIVVACLAAVAFSLWQTGKSPVVNQVSAIGNRNDQSSGQPVISTANAPNEQGATNAPDEKKTYEEASALATVAQAAYAEAQTILAAVALLFTVALCWVAIGEWKVNQATLAITTAIERAWIGVTDTTLHSFAPNQPLGVSVTFKNTGNTPAHINVVKVRVDVIGKDRRPQLAEKPEYGTDGFLVETTIMPGQDFTSYPDYSLVQPMPEHAFKDVQDGNANLYIYGCVEYTDLLTRTKRITKFARRYDGPNSVLNNRQVFFFPRVTGYNEST